jgi:beta-glucosidase
MILEENIVQLNLPSIGFDLTRPILSGKVYENIRRRLVSGISRFLLVAVPPV